MSELYGFRDWMTRRPGGSYPEKFESTLNAYCKERGIPCPGYVQHTGGDDEFLALALKTGRMVCVTYCGADGVSRYGSEVIGHMVNLVHLDETIAAILDNNFPGTWLWMSRRDFLARWRGIRVDGRPYLVRDGRGRLMPIGGGWAIVLLQAPPPPYPDQPPVMFGQQDCPDGRCPLHPQPSSSMGQWLPNANGREWGFWANGRCVAAAFADGRVEATNEHGIANGVQIAPPAPLPAGLVEQRPQKTVRVEPPAQSDEPFLQGGVIPERLTADTRYWRNGEPCTREEAHTALSLADDSERWNLTIVGEPGFTRKVRDDVANLPASVRAKLHVQSYSPKDWQVAQFKLPVGVTLRKPAHGRVGADIGMVPMPDYSAAHLGELLKSDGGPMRQPNPRPRLEPTPSIEPSPTSQPAEPPPQPARNSGGLILLTSLIALTYLILRR